MAGCIVQPADGHQYQYTYFKGWVMEQDIVSRLEKLPGKIGFYYKNLATGEVITYQEDESFQAASVIKLYIMAEAVRQCREGILSRDDMISVDRESCVPSCGALTYMHDGLEVSIQDLYTLMIILSDNSATNILIDILGEDAVNEGIRALGHTKTQLNRKMYDTVKSAQGIQNYVCPLELGIFLEQLYNGEVFDADSSEHMLSVMKNQRLNGKIPFYIHTIPGHGPIAHKTGEDTGITHDVGIVYAKQPFVLVFLGNDTDVARYEREMADISRMLYEANDVDFIN